MLLRSILRISRRLLCVLACLFLLHGTASADPYRVGVILPLSGPLGFQGESFRNAMTLACERLCENRIQLFFEDDAFQVKNALSAYRKLHESDRIQFLMIFGANQGATVSALTERAGIPTVSFSVLPSVVENKKFAVLFFANVPNLMNELVTEVKRRKLSRIAVLSTIQDATLLQKELLLKSGAAEVIFQQEFAPEDREIRAAASRVAALRPDGVALMTLPPQGSLFAKQLRTAGYTNQIFGTIQLASLSELAASEGALKDAWVSTGDDQQANNFLSDMAHRFPGYKATFESVYGYDAIAVLVQSLKEGKDPNDYFHSLKHFAGASGVFSADGKNSFTFPARIKYFEADRLVSLPQ